MPQDQYHARRPINPTEPQPINVTQALDALWWKAFPLRLIRPTPKWDTRDANLPLLSAPGALGSVWRIAFGGTASRAMDTFAFETRPGSITRYVGVTAPTGAAPSAYLIYFRHSLGPGHFVGRQTVLATGLGDHLVGRFQISQQISASGKNVAAVVPIALGGDLALSEFEKDDKFILECLEQIDKRLFNQNRPLPPILACSYSDGIGRLDKFLKNCPRVRGMLKAVYDLDGSYVTRFQTKVDLADLSDIQVFRYDGGAAVARRMTPPPKETDSEYLVRATGKRPARIPVPVPRWRSHAQLMAKGGTNDWLHYYIPSCMLQHALASTAGI